MKRIWITMAVALLAIPLSLCIFGFLLPPQYDDTFLGELKTKRALLAAESQQPRIILVGGSAVAFGVDSALMEEALPDYDVVNYGMYAALGTRIMLDLSLPELREGDVVIVIPEQQRQTLSDDLGAASMWQAADGDYDALLALHARDVGPMLSAYPAFAISKLRYTLTGGPEIEGIYRRDSFNADGDIESDLCTANVMAGGYDPTTMMDWDLSLPTDEFCIALNDYTAAAGEAGAAVWYHFPPMNAAAINAAADKAEMDPDTTIDTYAASLQERIDALLAGDPKSCVMDSGWFYDTNYHLNSSGRTVYTRQLVRDIKAMLGDSSPTTIEVPEMPAMQYVAETAADNRDAAYYLYEMDADGIVLTGLTEAGLAQTTLVVPGEIDGQPVTTIGTQTFQGADRLIHVTIQENIASLPDGLFTDCHSLEQIILLQDDPSRLLVGQNLLDGTPDTCRIVVPPEAYTYYCVSYSWSVYSSYITIDSH